ncbi:PAS domain-containing protein [Mycolicibacterium komossense]|uniref:DUF5593 domain-containing protein n=1 Tax=Mycolicibacterium komossense TaxID=1779 RepID=A0ABT3CLU1_9MYCO|nr:PAS domain-containing protein [Mycolicibacterium komossense]MCV7230460.1 DUF5593 domain-containing protein [Mycolicibacterium komossense]
MSHDWLLVETLGSEPAVVAQGRQLKNLVPLSAFLRRNPHLSAIQTAIAETIAGGTALASITSKKDRVIRTEPVRMSDGKVHGVHIWFGPAGVEPPERAIPGPLVWDLTTGVATDTPESLSNSGMDPLTEATHGRAFAEDLPRRDLNPSETTVLSLAVKSQPGATICNTWDVTDCQGDKIAVGFVARTNLEPADDGSEHLLARAMNWRGQRENLVVNPDHLAQRILDGLAQPGSYRALIDIHHWKLLKWLDEPCPLYDWRNTARNPLLHPDDRPQINSMTQDFESGKTVQRLLRLRADDGGWARLHVTVHRVELEAGIYAGLITVRLPTEEDLADQRRAQSCG